MMKLRAVWITAVLLLCANAVCRADISPTEFIGSAVVPKAGTPVQMLKADVEIVWGTPCTMTASFVMLNPTTVDQPVVVAFPMPGGEYMHVGESDPLTITFDGKAANITPPGKSKEDRDERRYWVWHRCEHVFRPGKTEVVVKSVLRASLVYATAYREALYYCIESGGKWAGNIGEETVRIRFPSPIEHDQITSAVPSGYEIRGNVVQWRFSNFKPHGKEYDIELTYLRPDAMRVISELRAKLNANPESASAKVSLAKNLVALGNGKSNSGFPPWRLSKEEFTRLRDAIDSAENRKLLVDHYEWKNDDVGFEEKSTEWTSERVSLVQVLADASYRDEASRAPFILEAERLFKSAIRAEPHNAGAWNAYLANYWRFSFAALGHWFGPTVLGREQKRLIEEAAHNCPDDRCIALWLAITRARPENRSSEALNKAIKDGGYEHSDLPVPKYDYY